MIISGSHTPGVSVEDFRLPPHTALRYERPAPALARFVPAYGVFDSDGDALHGTQDWLMPRWAQIWILFTDAPVGVRIGNRAYDPVPTASLIGPTSRAMPIVARGGVSIMVDVSPLGWGRLFRARADRLADRIVPLDTVLPAPLVAELVTALLHSDRGPEVKAILDRFFAAHLLEPYDDEPIVERLMRAIMDDHVIDAEDAAAHVGVDIRRLRGIARRYFGFTTITLLLRTRFLKAMLPLLDDTSGADIRALPPRYHDASHFRRDARRFLGMTARRFLALDRVYSKASMRGRVATLGSALSALDFTLTSTVAVDPVEDR